MSQKQVVVGQPVAVKAEILNQGDKGIEIVSLLDPGFGFLRFAVTDPDMQIRRIRSLDEYSMERVETLMLEPSGKLAHTILLLCDHEANSIFAKSGEYKIQAFYDAKEARDTVIISKPIAINVVKAQGVDAKAQQLFVGRKQAMLASGYGRDQASVEKFDKIMRKYPKSRFAPFAAYYLGLYYGGDRKYQKSVDCLERVLFECKDFPMSVDARYQLAVALHQTGRKDRARKCLEELAAEAPDDLIARRAKDYMSEL